MWPIRDPIAAIMPPIALLNRPAPIIGITTVCATSQSTTPQIVPRTADEPEGLRARDPVALRAVVDEHGRRLYRAARGMGFSPGDAEDLAERRLIDLFHRDER
jgi:hypothetical protein